MPPGEIDPSRLPGVIPYTGKRLVVGADGTPSSFRMLAAWVVLAVEVTASIPRPAQYFDQLVNHFDLSSATYRQRFYSYDGYFGGPSSPIICIIGGEGAIPPETGIFYPWIVDVVAKHLNALVIEPEHRFYGESIPVGGAPFNASQLKLLTPDQALADAVHLIQWAQRANNCTARGMAGYCPVITIGGVPRLPVCDDAPPLSVRGRHGLCGFGTAHDVRAANRPVRVL